VNLDFFRGERSKTQICGAADPGLRGYVPDCCCHQITVQLCCQLSGEDDRSARKPSHQTSDDKPYVSHLLESTKSSTTEGLSERYNKQSVMESVPDNTSSFADRRNLVIPAAATASLRSVSASSRLPPLTSFTTNQHNTRNSDDFPRCNTTSAAANLFLADSRSLAQQETVNGHEAWKGDRTEIPSKKSEKSSSTQLIGKAAGAGDKKKIVRGTSTELSIIDGRMEKKRTSQLPTVQVWRKQSTW